MHFDTFFAAGISPLVWAKVYSHTDRRHIFSTLTDPGAERPCAPSTIPKDGAMLLRVSIFPLSSEHPSAQRGERHRHMILTERKTQLPQDCYAFYGAVWNPKKPTWLRIATRPLALPEQTNVYAEMMAETKPGSVPVLLECLLTINHTKNA